jgi:hypothetical protein
MILVRLPIMGRCGRFNRLAESAIVSNLSDQYNPSDYAQRVDGLRMHSRLMSATVFGVIATAVFAGDPPQSDPSVLPTPIVADQSTPNKVVPPKPTTPPRAPAATSQVETLKSELESLIRERETASKSTIEEPSNMAERAKLKSKVLSLIDRLETKKPTPPVTMPPAKTPDAVITTPKVDISEGATDGDRLRSAENYFRSNNVDASLRVLNMTEPTNLTRDERIYADYLKACCLRKLGKVADAKVLYRKIADDKADEFLTESSLTQLQILNQTQEIEDRLTQLRASRKKQ